MYVVLYFEHTELKCDYVSQEDLRGAGWMGCLPTYVPGLAAAARSYKFKDQFR